VGGDEVMSVGLVRAVKEVKKSGILRGFNSYRFRAVVKVGQKRSNRLAFCKGFSSIRASG